MVKRPKNEIMIAEENITQSILRLEKKEDRLEEFLY
jgi:hypothetical protein